MKGVEQLSREERLRRIGALLSKGVTSLLTREQERARDQALPPQKVDGASQLSEATEQTADARICPETVTAILGYLGRVGSGSPRNIQTGLGLPKTTVYRYLRRLVLLGKVARSGQTTSVCYRLRAEVSQVNQATLKKPN
jgi:hypothetical protein